MLGVFVYELVWACIGLEFGYLYWKAHYFVCLLLDGVFYLSCCKYVCMYVVSYLIILSSTLPYLPPHHDYSCDIISLRLYVFF